MLHQNALLFILGGFGGVAKSKGNRTIRALLDLRPMTARLLGTNGAMRGV